MTTVVQLSGFLDPRELESNSYFDIVSEIERQLMKFGSIKSYKILRESEGYTSAGNVLVQYERIEAAVLCRFTLQVRAAHPGHEVRREVGQGLVLRREHVLERHPRN